MPDSNKPDPTSLPREPMPTSWKPLWVLVACLATLTLTMALAAVAADIYFNGWPF